MNRKISKLTKPCLLAAFTGLVVVAFGFTGDSAAADEYHRINRAAVKIRNQTRSLLRETEHYVRTTNYRLLVSDTAEIRQQAEHIREIAYSGCDLEHLATEVAQMHRTFGHLENLFDNTELLASQCHGSVKGHTAHVKRLLESIDECICDMQADLDVLLNPVVIAPPVVARRTVGIAQPVIYPPSPYRYGSQRPIVTNVQTYRVPARAAYGLDYNYGGRGYGPRPGCQSRR
jgi:hypothetical protein